MMSNPKAPDCGSNEIKDSTNDSAIMPPPSQPTPKLAQLEREIDNARRQRKRETEKCIKQINQVSSEIKQQDAGPARTRMRTRKQKQLSESSGNPETNPSLDTDSTTDPLDSKLKRKRLCDSQETGNFQEIRTGIPCPNLQTHNMESATALDLLQIRLQKTWRKTFERRQRKTMSGCTKPFSSLQQNTCDAVEKRAKQTKLDGNQEPIHVNPARSTFFLDVASGRYKVANSNPKKTKIRRNIKRKFQLDQTLKVMERENPGSILKCLVKKQARRRNLYRSILHMLIDPANEPIENSDAQSSDCSGNNCRSEQSECENSDLLLETSEIASINKDEEFNGLSSDSGRKLTKREKMRIRKRKKAANSAARRAQKKRDKLAENAEVADCTPNPTKKLNKREKQIQRREKNRIVQQNSRLKSSISRSICKNDDNKMQAKSNSIDMDVQSDVDFSCSEVADADVSHESEDSDYPNKPRQLKYQHRRTERERNQNKRQPTDGANTQGVNKQATKQEKGSKSSQFSETDDKFTSADSAKSSNLLAALGKSLEIRESHTQQRKVYDLAKTVLKKQLKSKASRTLAEAVQAFKELKNEGATHVCVCCAGMFFRDQMKKIISKTIQSAFDKYEEKCPEFRSEICYLEKYPDFICRICTASVILGKIPTIALANGFDLPDIPDVIKNLSPLEELLCSPRIPFMKIFAVKPYGQFKLKGGIVNIWNPLNKTVEILPRELKDSCTMLVALNRRLGDSNPYIREIIRPHVVYMACKYLVTTQLYIDAGITLSDLWDEIEPGESIEFELQATLLGSKLPKPAETTDNLPINPNQPSNDTEPSVGPKTEIPVIPAPSKTKHKDYSVAENSGSDSDEDSDACVDDPKNAGTIKEKKKKDSSKMHGETMVSDDQPKSTTIAPGEGLKPIDILTDPCFEGLCFPRTNMGHRPNYKEGIKPSIAQINKSHVRHFDGRFRRPEILFLKAKKAQIYQCQNAVNVALRKLNNQDRTVQQMLDNAVVKHLITENEGLQMLKDVSYSPSYWREKQHNLMATIRQIGTPTLFMTLSSAETKWTELIKILNQVKPGGPKYTDEDCENLGPKERNEMINADPATCARYFNHRFLSLKTTLLSCPDFFAGHKMIDLYYRYEVQHRGSLHVHMMVWVESPPKFERGNPESYKKVTEFVDKIITCFNDKNPDFQLRLSKYQSHRHTRTCKRLIHNSDPKQYRCRFNFPAAPMKETTILFPLHEEMPKFNKKGPDLLTSEEKARLDLYEMRRKEARDNLHKVKDYLSNLNTDDDVIVTFDEFLAELGLLPEKYLDAIRYSLKRETLMLKRDPDATFINAYNPTLSESWQANVDIQFILDPFNCVKYIATYINKSCRGVSKLVREVAKNLPDLKRSTRSNFWSYCSTVINGSEMSAQEAACICLSIPMSKSSRTCQFIPTQHPTDRLQVVKSKELLRKMCEAGDQDSTNVCYNGILHHYENRDKQLEDKCLAHVCAWYEYLPNKPSTPKSKPKNQDPEDGKSADEEDEPDSPVENSDDNWFPVAGGGFHHKRKTPKIIRFRNFNPDKERLAFFREQVMLYVPYRNEKEDILDKDWATVFRDNKVVIETNRAEFDPHNLNNDLQLFLDQIENEEELDMPHVVIDEDFAFSFDDGPIPREKKLDGKGEKPQRFKSPKNVEEKDWQESTRRLNLKQQMYLTRVMERLKFPHEHKRPFCDAVLGCAGTGKSTLIHAACDGVVLHFSKMPGEDPLKHYEIRICPSGVAAASIDGYTIHAALSIHPMHDYPLINLGSNVLANLQFDLMKIQWIVLDEVSMLGIKLLAQLEQRLREIRKSNAPFGGVNFTFLGDLNQLPPVKQSPIFNPNPNHHALVLASQYLWKNRVKGFFLDEIMRQREDQKFAEFLGHILTGTVTEEEHEMINGRIGIESPPGATHLFSMNKHVEAFNREYLAKLTTEGATVLARDRIDGTASEEKMDELRATVKGMSRQDTHSLHSSLELKVGAKYMVTTNISVKDKLVNGAVGELLRIERGGDGARVVRVWLDFKDPNVGREQRQKHGHPTSISTPIDVCTVEIYHKYKCRVIRYQFPLTCAAALTVHKSQGLTCEYVCVHLDQHQTMSLPSFYTAFSRVTSLKGLSIQGVKEVKFPQPKSDADNAILQEILRLKQNPIKFSFENLFQSNQVLLFMNCQSFIAHKKDIESNFILNTAAVMMFVEGRTLPTEICDLPGYDCVFRRNSQTNSKKHSSGTLVFAKPELSILEIENLYQEFGKGHVELVVLQYEDIKIILGYSSPSVPTRSFLPFFECTLSKYSNENLIVVGDYNLNLNAESGRSFKTLLNSHGLDSLLPATVSTTYMHTQIDICFSNRDPKPRAQLSAATFSSHRPMYITLDQAPPSDSGSNESSDEETGYTFVSKVKQLQLGNDKKHEKTPTPEPLPPATTPRATKRPAAANPPKNQESSSDEPKPKKQAPTPTKNQLKDKNPAKSSTSNPPPKSSAVQKKNMTMRQRINTFLAELVADELVFEPFGMLVSIDSFSSLRDGIYLEASVINSMLECIFSRTREDCPDIDLKDNMYPVRSTFCYKLYKKYIKVGYDVPSVLTQNLDQILSSILFMPCLSNFHWFLCEINFPAQTMYIMDSRPGTTNNIEHLGEIKKLIAKITDIPPHFWNPDESVPVPHQGDSHSCGDWTIRNLESRILGRPYANANISGFRQEMAEIIMTFPTTAGQTLLDACDNDLDLTLQIAAEIKRLTG